MSSLPLPESWIEIDIGEINHHKSKSINPSDCPDETFELYSVPIFPTGKPEYIKGEEIGSSKQEVEPGDVLLCKINPRINRVWFVANKGRYRQIASSEWIVVRQPLMSSKFLRAYFSEYNFRQLLCSEVTGVGGSLTRAQPKKVAGYPVRFPSKNEQTRIANKLDELLAQVDTIKARVDAIPAILKRFRQSVLAAAVSGKLTEEWREDGEYSFDLKKLESQKDNLLKSKKIKKDLVVEPACFEFDIPNSWMCLQLGSVAIKITDGEHKTPKREESGRYLLSARNVRNGHIDLSKVDYVGEEEYEKLRKRCDPELGDILISCSGSVGRIALVDKSDSYVMVRSAALVKTMEGYVDNAYLMYCLQSPQLQKVIEQKAKSTAQANLFLGPIKELPIPFPSIEEQHEVVCVIERLLSFSDLIEDRIIEANARISNLTQSILSKAFKGELVPQDPSDELASELLARIQQVREEADQLAKAAKKATRKPRQKRSASK